MATIAILSGEGFPFLMRWFHIVAGILWVGLLYYWSMVQEPFLTETSAEVRLGVQQAQFPRILGSLRASSTATFATGLLMVVARIATDGVAVLRHSWGVSVSIGALLGTLMLLNAWLIVWPNQQIVVAWARGQDTGGRDPVACANRAFVATRMNVLFSIPMLFFMGAASHLTLFDRTTPVQMGVGLAAVGAVIGLFEVVAIFGEKGKGGAAMLDRWSATVSTGVALALFAYLVLEIVV